MDPDLRVMVEGVVYETQIYGGISRIYNEILPRMCCLDDSLRITLPTEGRFGGKLPEHRHIEALAFPPISRRLRHRRALARLAPLVRQLVQQGWLGSGAGQIWHSTSYNMPLYWRGQTVVTVLDMIHELFPGLLSGRGRDRLRARKRRCIESADAVICISETTRHDLLHFCDVVPERISVIPLACSRTFRQLHKWGGRGDTLRRPFLMYVGRRGLYKNFATLVRAYGRWSGRDEVELLAVGEPWTPCEERELASLGLEESVSVLTGVADEALCVLYNEATAFVYPSLYEGFGLPLLESMACGCPVVASRIPSSVEVAGDCAVYFDPIDEDDLMAALDSAVSEGRGTDRVARGLVRAREYSWDSTAGETLRVYRSLHGTH